MTNDLVREVPSPMQVPDSLLLKQNKTLALSKGTDLEINPFPPLFSCRICPCGIPWLPLLGSGALSPMEAEHSASAVSGNFSHEVLKLSLSLKPPVMAAYYGD